MAEQDVDIEALSVSEDEVVDLTVDDDDWDEIEVDSLYNGQASVLYLRLRSRGSCCFRTSAILNKTSRKQPLKTPDRAKICR